MQIFPQGVHSIMQNNSKYTINSHRFHLSGSQSLSHIATIPFHLWFIYMVFPLSLPCLWPWVRLEIMHQPSSLHHPSCCQSSLLKINSENRHFPYFISSVWLCLAFKVFHDLGLLWFSSLPIPQELLQPQHPSKNLPRSSQCLSSSATGFHTSTS